MARFAAWNSTNRRIGHGANFGVIFRINIYIFLRDVDCRTNYRAI